MDEKQTRNAEKTSEHAASQWSPSIMYNDAEIIRFARRCFADGYAAALLDIGKVKIKPSNDPIKPDWPVAPC